MSHVISSLSYSSHRSFFPLCLLLLVGGIFLFSSSPTGLPSLLSVGGEKLDDCCCELETIETGNDEALHDKLQKLRTFTFFRIFKVNLYSDCPFWRENMQCSRINCAVCGECKNEDLPEPWRIPTTDPVDRTLFGGFQGWSDRDDSLWIVQDDSEHMSYINMELNPEGYTGYEGFAPHRIWSAIYQENCFQLGKTPTSSSSSSSSNSRSSGFLGSVPSNSPPPPPMDPLPEIESKLGVMQPAPSTVATHDDEVESLCYEQRVLYRLLSGMHASISTHIANGYPVGTVDPNVDIHAKENCALIGANLTIWQERVGQYPERRKNMYFAFVFMMRAVNKASGLLRHYNYHTGNTSEDDALRTVIHSFLDSPLVTTCSSDASFDETTMFTSSKGHSLRTQLKHAFRNISRIMDCVGCEKCKLHGKLQVLGFGTALKILFNDEKMNPLKLERNEVMAFIVTLSKLSHSLHVSREFETRIRAEEAKLKPDVILPITIAVFVGGLTAIVMLVWHLYKRRPQPQDSIKTRTEKIAMREATKLKQRQQQQQETQQ